MASLVRYVLPSETKVGFAAVSDSFVCSLGMVQHFTQPGFTTRGSNSGFHLSLSRSHLSFTLREC
jgi:hypothetical protein